MALFDGSILRSITQNVLPVAAPLLGSYFGAQAGAQTTSVSQVAVAPVQTTPSKLDTVADGTGFFDQKVAGLPMILVVAIGAVVAWKFLK